MKQLWIFPFVVLAGMGLSVEAGLLGPLGEEIGHMWATLGIFAVGSLLLTFGLIFGRPRLGLMFKQPRWQLTGGILGPIYVIALTIATPHIGVGLTMVGILLGQIATSLVIDHWGLLGSRKRRVDQYRIAALIAVLAALWLIQ
ncbi:EamA-like transporter family protein [Acinetobacter wanghuae]|uniref:EamA-like transporter family protein n=1 Tax=Acinetobacter wanghuae TaxID=2662362 RepID=A0A5Q0P7A1_9GAMM|nr:DMT family transporter [Acinetobacter wanghuae]MQW92664.1 EamA-like transporter family protein [Acinetobacter wanghuae]QGA12220.1 EamA-like transporter family protein [Acinetobacter wanghuae]